MEHAISTDEDDQFLDASDEFFFYDCIECSSSSSQSTPSFSSFLDSYVIGEGLRRRRSRKLRDFERDSRNFDSDRAESTSETVVQGVNEEEKESSTVITCENSTGSPPLPPPPPPPVGERENDDRQFISSPPLPQQAEEKESSTVTTEEKRTDAPPPPPAAPPVGDRENVDGQFSSLGIIAEFIVKAIEFQFKLLISFVSFPFWMLYYSCLLVVNPLHIFGLARSFLIAKFTSLWRRISDSLSPFVYDWLEEHKSWFDLASRLGWGVFWSVFVCCILVTLLIGAFVIGGLLMRYCVVEEPFMLKQGLNFDYTKSKPVAFVPIVTCPAAEFEDKNDVRFARVIPPNHKLKATVTMVLPESDYNRNLGMFQVRVDFLSKNGKSLASFSHPCMLAFKSQPLRLLLTFFKIVPLVAGYLSETQTLKLKFRGYKEGVIPTACLKITMEQRAEFRPAAGIPEVYDAFVHLESELPFFKRILWYWRRTIFVWLSMMVFTVELLFALVCCRPVIFPRARTRSNVAGSNTPLTAHPVQT